MSPVIIWTIHYDEAPLYGYKCPLVKPCIMQDTLFFTYLLGLEAASVILVIEDLMFDSKLTKTGLST